VVAIVFDAVVAANGNDIEACRRALYVVVLTEVMAF